MADNRIPASKRSTNPSSEPERPSDVDGDAGNGAGDTPTGRDDMNMMTKVTAADVNDGGSIDIPSGSTWDAALADYREKRAAYDAACSAQSAAEEAYFDAKPVRPTFTIEEPEVDYGELGKHVLTVTIMHEELDDPSRTWADPVKIKEFRRQLADYRTAEAVAREKTGYGLCQASSLAAMKELTTALDRLIEVPVPNMAALAEKVEIVNAEYGDPIDSEIGDVLTSVLADVRRMAVTTALTGFARAWLELWTADGGSFHRNSFDDGFMMGRAEYSFSPVAERDRERRASMVKPASTSDAAWTEMLRSEEARTAAFHDGRMRGLDDLLHAVPGGVDVVKAAVIADPTIGYPKSQEA